MNHNHLTTHEHDKPLGFLDYSQLCNQGAGCRKEGILDEDLYTETCRDADTLMIDKVPVVATIKHGHSMGYDLARAVLLAEPSASDIRFLTLPFRVMSAEHQDDTLQRLLEQSKGAPVALYYSELAENGVCDDVLIKALERNTVPYSSIPLFDERIEDPRLKEASLSLFICDVKRSNDDSAGKIGLTVIAERAAVGEPGDISLRMGNTLTQDEVDAMWNLYLDRFEFLGDGHPISMEDTKEDYQKMLTSEHTMVAAKSVDGKPVCLTFFMDNFYGIYWLNQTYLNKIQAAALPDQTPLFFQGIVASGSGSGFAGEVIAKFAETAAQAGMSAMVCFENTNLSEQYIPKIVYGVLAKRPEFSVGIPEKVDESRYRLVVLNPQES